MFGLNLRRGKKRRVAIIDVGSASTASGIMDVKIGEKSSLIAANRSFIPYEKRTKEQFASRMGEAIGESIAKAMQALTSKSNDKDRNAASVGEAFVFFRFPWIDAHVEKLVKQFEVETKITQSHIDALGKEAVDTTKKILEAMILRVEVNGYPTAGAIGKLGHIVSAYALVTTVDSDLQSRAESYVMKALPQVKPKYRTHTSAILSCISERDASTKNVTVVDISSESSSILAIRDGILQSQVSFDTGVHSILERLSKNALPEETLGLLRMIEREQCSGEQCESIKTNMEKVEQDLVREFGEQFAILSKGVRLPQELLLFVHPDIAPWLLRFFSRLDFAQFTIPLQPFTVGELTIHDMQQWVQVDGTNADVSLLTAASLIHIEANR